MTQQVWMDCDGELLLIASTPDWMIAVLTIEDPYGNDKLTINHSISILLEKANFTHLGEL